MANPTATGIATGLEMEVRNGVIEIPDPAMIAEKASSLEVEFDQFSTTLPSNEPDVTVGGIERKANIPPKDIAAPPNKSPKGW